MSPASPKYSPTSPTSPSSPRYCKFPALYSAPQICSNTPPAAPASPAYSPACEFHKYCYVLTQTNNSLTFEAPAYCTFKLRSL